MALPRMFTQASSRAPASMGRFSPAWMAHRPRASFPYTRRAIINHRRRGAGKGHLGRRGQPVCGTRGCDGGPHACDAAAALRAASMKRRLRRGRARAILSRDRFKVGLQPAVLGGAVGMGAQPIPKLQVSVQFMTLRIADGELMRGPATGRCLPEAHPRFPHARMPRARAHQGRLDDGSRAWPTER